MHKAAANKTLRNESFLIIFTLCKIGFQQSKIEPSRRLLISREPCLRLKQVYKKKNNKKQRIYKREAQKTEKEDSTLQQQAYLNDFASEIMKINFVNN